MGGTELVKRTALAAVYAGVALPLTVFKSATTAFDSEFTQCKVRLERRSRTGSPLALDEGKLECLSLIVSQDKARKAGVLLAEILEKE
ncbi:hypothetical protein, partial [Serratia proteamaculans]